MFLLGVNHSTRVLTNQRNGITALHVAAQQNCVPALEFLLDPANECMPLLDAHETQARPAGPAAPPPA
jgi:hypothetical protein